MSIGYLQTILGDLRRARLIRSRRGHDGGYRLARPAAQITVADHIGGPVWPRSCSAAAGLEV